MVDKMSKGQYYVYYLLGYLPYVLWYKLVCYCDLFYFAAAFYNNRRQPGNFFSDTLHTLNKTVHI